MNPDKRKARRLSERMNPDKRKARRLSEFTRNQDEGELLVSNLKMLLVFFDENFDKICAYEKINIPSITK